MEQTAFDQTPKMESKSIQNVGTLLALAILGIIAWYGRSPHTLLAGVVYLVAAGYLTLFGVLTATRVRIKERGGAPDQAAWSLHLRAYIFVLSACQVSIIGMLDVWASMYGKSHFFIGSYMLAVLFIILSYKIVAITDDPSQEGGSMPLNYFGYPRSRRLLYSAFIYTPVGLLAVAGILIFLDWRWCPVPFQPPQLCLLLVALSATMLALMTLHRYRRAPQNRATARKLAVGTIIVLILSAALQMTLAYSLYVYALSSVTVLFLAATIYWLSLARQRIAAAESIVG